jgi:hypothetical protein
MASPRLSSMCMFLGFECNGHSNEPSVTYATLRDNLPSEVPHILHRAPQHRYLHATVVIKVDVHRHNRQIMVLVRGPGQALRQFAVVMIVDVDERRHACLCALRRLLHLCNSRSGEITNRLRSVLVAKRGNHVIERRDELVVDRNGDSLHTLPAVGPASYDVSIWTSYDRYAYRVEMVPDDGIKREHGESPRPVSSPAK